MAKVKLESSNHMSLLRQSVGEVNKNMQDDLSLLNKAFAVACESWNDKNAQTCAAALANHNSVMRSAFSKLDGFESALKQLAELAGSYEDI